MFTLQPVPRSDSSCSTAEQGFLPQTKNIPPGFTESKLSLGVSGLLFDLFLCM